MITIFSTNSRITNKFFKVLEVLGEGNPTLENPLNQIPDILINPDYVSPEPFSANRLQDAIQEARIPEVEQDEPVAKEKKRGGITGRILSLSLATLACGGSLTSCGSGYGSITGGAQRQPSPDNPWAQPDTPPPSNFQHQPTPSDKKIVVETTVQLYPGETGQKVTDVQKRLIATGNCPGLANAIDKGAKFGMFGEQSQKCSELVDDKGYILRITASPR